VGVPKDIWHVFEEPGECYELVKEAVGGGELNKGTLEELEEVSSGS
jgi:hypothetical protein